MHFYPHFPQLTRTPSPVYQKNQVHNKKKKANNCLIFIKSCSDSYKRLKTFNLLDNSLSYIHKVKEPALSSKIKSKTPVDRSIDDNQKISFLPPIKSEQMIRKLAIGNELSKLELTSKEVVEAVEIVGKLTRSYDNDRFKNKGSETKRKVRTFLNEGRIKKAKIRIWKNIKVKKIISSRAVQVDFDDSSDITGWDS